MRRLATVRQIADIRPIEGADKIVVAQVDGWECVIQKDEFNIGDKVVYVEVDSIMPEKPEYEFLRKRKFRVKNNQAAWTDLTGTCPADVSPSKGTHL